MLEEILQEIDELNKKITSFIPAVKEDILQKKKRVKFYHK